VDFARFLKFVGELKVSMLFHMYRRRRYSLADLPRDLPAELQDSNNHSGYQRSQVLTYILMHFILESGLKISLQQCCIYNTGASESSCLHSMSLYNFHSVIVST